MDLTLAQGHCLRLTPQVIQSMHILQMDSVQLVEYLQELSLENPLIDFPNENCPWEDGGPDRVPLPRSPGQGDSQTVFPEDIAADRSGESLTAYLTAQINLLTAAPETRHMAKLLALSLDEDGYLAVSLQSMAEQFGKPLPQWEEALAVVQHLEPAGVGARTLAECLRLQLPPEDRLAHRLTAYLPDVAEKRWKKLARMLGVTAAEIRQASGRLCRLEPRPGRAFSAPEPLPFIIPDVRVEIVDHIPRVSLCHPEWYRFHINPEYRRLAGECADESVGAYLHSRMEQVDWLTGCIAKREKTLLAAARLIACKQTPYLVYGAPYMEPLELKNIAKALGMNESTVSRTISGKYLISDRGVFPLHGFFARGIETADGGSVSYQQIRWEIGRLAYTDSAFPRMTDAQIAARFGQRGIPISERTVSKYRRSIRFDDRESAGAESRRSYGCGAKL